MSIRLLEILESIPIAPKILEKFSFLQRCRFRSTCRQMDALVEKHRFYLSKKKYEEVDICVLINSENAFTVEYYIEDCEGEKILRKPIKELSGLFIDSINFKLSNSRKTKKQSELVRIFQKWKPCVGFFEAGDFAGFSVTTILGILSSASIRNLQLNFAKISIEKEISMEVVQNATYLTLNVNKNGVPAERFLERLTKVKRVLISGVTKKSLNYMVNTVIPQMMQEADSLAEDIPCPSISFTWPRTPVNPEMTCPNLYLIYSKVVPQKYEEDDDDEDDDDFLENFAKKCYALNLQKRILLLFDDKYETQTWRIYFVKREKDELKKILEKETADPCPDRLLNHMFKKLVGNSGNQ